MITKEEAVKELIKRGYEAKLESSVVTVFYEHEQKIDFDTIKGILKDIGYKCSFGIRGKKSTDISVSSLATSETGQMEFAF